MCSDDDWVSKCPSGCRLQGLIWQTGGAVETRLWTACQTLKTLEGAAEESMKATASVYSSQRRLVVGRYTSELKFAELADGLSGNLTSLRQRSTSLWRQLEELSGSVRTQLEDLYRTEVDADMKLRACHGSCRSALPFDVDHSSYQRLQTDLDKTLSRRNKAAVPPADVPRIKLLPEYETIPMVQTELLTQFEDIGQNQLTLVESVDVEALDAAELERPKL
ncbi:fibrinogen alpha chain [Stegastes partitus]|uniref:Fibrinogen alpha chain n=1 Tax=Stegastes partitus TaxID=144197 RepID=A0A9Y4NCY4_9TELE|nr:PREDICTED: fibrinogen alpha chain-like [Stegastes partitus]